MPLYYFSLQAGDKLTAEDPEELLDDKAAEEHAARVASEIGDISEGSGKYIVAENAEGREVARIPLRPPH